MAHTVGSLVLLPVGCLSFLWVPKMENLPTICLAISCLVAHEASSARLSQLAFGLPSSLVFY